AVLIGGAGEAIAPIAITGAVVGFIIRAIADARAPQETPAHS
ncbi:MAG: hypothetical protein RLY59_956, partial [Actinomycetota bacterium]